MRSAVFLAFTFAACAHAGVIRGTVVEKMTGYYLARSVITLQPVSVFGQAERTIRASELGVFEIGDLPAGSYVLKASRRGFLPMEYGQRRWNAAGRAIVLKQDDVANLRLELSRFGAIVGTVRDGNEAGIPDQDVAAYFLTQPTTQPPQLVSRTKTDDRGMFRVGGLTPGTYLV